MLSIEHGIRVIRCDHCRVQLVCETTPETQPYELAEQAQRQRWRVTRRAGIWYHICPSHPPERQGKLL